MLLCCEDINRPSVNNNIKMPFKIIKTINEKTNREELCICPSEWEKQGTLRWPKKKARKYYKNEDSIPKPEWAVIKCTVKRRNIPSYEIAEKLLGEMLDCSTTEIDEDSAVVVAAATPPPVVLPTVDRAVPVRQIYEFNIMANQATSQELPVLSEQNFQPAFSNDEAATIDVEGEVTQAQVIEASDHENITTNQTKIFKNQQEILKNQNIIMENQENIMMALAEFSVKLEHMVKKDSTEGVTLNNTTKALRNTAFCLKPIRNLAELSNFEDLLDDDDMRAEFKAKYSIVCQPGKASNCAYQLVDIFFSRDFLTQCSWSGSARGEGTKISLKLYKNVLGLFFDLIFDCDKSYTIAANEIFFKSILKNATKRKQSKLLRASTSRNSHKRSKPDVDSKKTKNNNASEAETVNQNKENIPSDNTVDIENKMPNADALKPITTSNDE